MCWLDYGQPSQYTRQPSHSRPIRGLCSAVCQLNCTTKRKSLAQILVGAGRQRAELNTLDELMGRLVAHFRLDATMARSTVRCFHRANEC